MNVRIKPVQIEYGIANKLSGPVIRDISATINLEEGGALFIKVFFMNQEIGPVSAFSQSINWRMFTQKQDMGDGPGVIAAFLPDESRL